MVCRLVFLHPVAEIVVGVGFALADLDSLRRRGSVLSSSTGDHVPQTNSVSRVIRSLSGVGMIIAYLLCSCAGRVQICPFGTFRRFRIAGSVAVLNVAKVLNGFGMLVVGI